jgi:uncharacterized protein YjbI with pentapeptide repeats
VPTPRPQHRVTRTFTNLSRRPPTPKDSEPPAPAPRPPAAPWLSRILRRRSPITPPTRAELDALPAKERQELIDARRQRPLQTLTTLVTSAGVLLGVAFTAYGFSYTAQTLRATQEGQITDRYTKAVEQLASPAVDVRLGAIYALQRTAKDSDRDRLTIRNVLAAFVRNNDFCSTKQPPKQCDNTSAKNPSATPKVRLATDVHAALTIAPTLTTPKDAQPDFSHVRFPNVDLFGADLTSLNLIRANLADADLTGADLTNTNLTNANLTNADPSNANLTSANLTDANLTNTDLIGADLTNAKLSDANLTDANLTRADLLGARLIRANLINTDLPRAELIDANLTGANLTNADLPRANLTRANLTGANLTNADLTGADLTGVTGMAADEIRDLAITDSATKF